MNDNQPGQLIVPHSDDPKPPVGGAPEPDRPVEEPESPPAPAAAPGPDTQATHAATPGAVAPVAPNGVSPQWQYHTDTTVDPQQRLSAPTKEIKWTATEFIEHQKSAGWYVAVVFCGLVLAILAYIIGGRDKISAGVVMALIIGFCLFAARRPGTQEYNISKRGIQVGTKAYSLHDFKTFSVSEEGTAVSIIFMPLKRFMPPLTIHVAPEVEDQVVDFLSLVLPFERIKTSVTDGFLRRIRF